MSCRNSVTSIADRIGRLFRIPIPGARKLPSTLALPSALARPGLSVSKITSSIISRFSEAGLVSGPDPAGNQNALEAYTHLVVEEIVNAICYDANMQVIIPPGSINVVSTGSNAGGPMLSSGTTLSAASATGIIQ